MKEAVLQLAAQAATRSQKLNVLREYVQGLVLASLHQEDAFQSITFLGGTALRFIYRLPRFSEDLDFAVEGPGPYRPEPWMRRVKRDLTLAGFVAKVSWNASSRVNRGWVALDGIMAEAGVSPLPDQKLQIKLEIDTAPPAGAHHLVTVLNQPSLFAVRHHDLPSLMAGKVGALCCRSFIKGRDWYDLLWYRTQRPPVSPNLDHLRAIVEQQVALGVTRFPAEAWADRIRARVEARGFPKDMRPDIERFLERPEEAALMTPESFLSVLPARVKG